MTFKVCLQIYEDSLLNIGKMRGFGSLVFALDWGDWVDS